MLHASKTLPDHPEVAESCYEGPRHLGQRRALGSSHGSPESQDTEGNEDPEHERQINLGDSRGQLAVA